MVSLFRWVCLLGGGVGVGLERPYAIKAPKIWSQGGFPEASEWKPYESQVSSVMQSITGRFLHRL